jgi:hypothetical protein
MSETAPAAAGPYNHDEGESMRTRTALAALAGTLLLAAPALAQTALTFGGVNPTRITNQPIAIPDSARPIAQPQNTLLGGFSLSNFLPKIPFPSANPVHGQSAFPTPANMPGKAYLNQFGYQRPQPIQ